MSDNYAEDDFDSESEDVNDIRNLRKAANAAKKLKNEMAELRRELAFAKAGLPLNDPKMKYFIKGYDGEMDPELIREAALQEGFITAQQPNQQAETQRVSADTSQAQRRIMSASAGAISEDTSEAAAISRMESAMQEGGLEAMLDVARQYGIPTTSDY